MAGIGSRDARLRVWALAGACLALAAWPATARGAGADRLAQERAACASETVAPPADLELEPVIAVDPRDDRNVVAAWIQGANEAVAFAVSSDRGATWKSGLVPGITRCGGGSDDLMAFNPSLAFGEDGVLYLAATRSNDRFPQPGSAVTRIAVARSLDGGRSWTTTQVPASELANDYPVVAALPGDGRAAVVWKKSGGMGEVTLLSRTRDGGRSWSPPETVRASSPERLAGSRLHALRDGTLLLVTSERSTAAVVASMLTGERMYRGAVEVTVSRLRPGAVGWETVRVFDLGRAWTHAVGFMGLASAVDDEGVLHLALPYPSIDGVRLRHVSTADGGSTWSDAKTVAELPAGWFPEELAVDGRGCVGVTTGDPSIEGNVTLLRRCRGEAWSRRVLTDAAFPQDQHPFYLAPAIAGTSSGFAVLATVAASGSIAPTELLHWDVPGGPAGPPAVGR